MAELTPGTEFAGCRIDAVVGRGGMGLVYRAVDLRLARPVAIKLIAGERASDDEFRARFEREARLTAAIDHPNVIPIYGAGEEHGHLYLVMRYVDGTDLQALLSESGRLSPARAAAVVAQVGQALDAAHAAGLVHRDVKPANVLLTGTHVYLSDFGIGRADSADTQLTDSGEWIGTVDFMAPEHLRAERTDARSDVYALGCVLYAALTGTSPFRRGTVPATVLAHFEDAPPRPSDVHPDLAPFDAVVARALAKAPAGRYQSAGDLGAAALAAAAGEPATRVSHSVATGPAAPSEEETIRIRPSRAPVVRRAPETAEPERNGHDAEPLRPEAAPAAAATLLRPDTAVATARAEPPPPRAAEDRPPPSPPKPVARHRSGRGGRGVAGSLVLAGVLVVAAIVVALVTANSGDARTGPLSAGEVRGVAEDFARAYAHEDSRALRRTLAPDVSRVSPTGVQRGRADVVAEYARQFGDYAVRNYTLGGLTATGGTAGRASATYAVALAGGSSITGHLVLGVVRDGTTPRIRLIAAEPRP
jgi:Protein kinase domain